MIEITEGEAVDLGYEVVRRLPNGELAGVLRMIYTAGLFVGLDRAGWRTRYCYPTFAQAEKALIFWDGEGDPPGPWIKQKPEDRLNPAFCNEEEGNEEGVKR